MRHIHQPAFEFEFRAFHKPTGKLFSVYGFDTRFVFDNSFDGVGATATNPANREDCVIDQWTGLLDQTERKIFSNDVVEVFNQAGNPVGLFRVIYINLQGHYILDGLTANTRSSRLTLYQKVRIVGNIHENPEFLNAKENY